VQRSCVDDVVMCINIRYNYITCVCYRLVIINTYRCAYVYKC